MISVHGTKEDSQTREARFTYQTSFVETAENDKHTVYPISVDLDFRTEMQAPKLGVMLVGLGGNNGTTIVGGSIANQKNMKWENKDSIEVADYKGSLMNATTMRVGANSEGDVYLPLRQVVPLVDPNSIEWSGWDISNTDLASAMRRAKVLDFDLQRQLRPHMESMVPLPSILYTGFIADNQSDRANNLIDDTKHACQHHLDTIRQQIRTFKQEKQLDKVIIVWTASTERFCEVTAGVHDTAENLLQAIKAEHTEVPPSQIFAVAAIQEGCAFINGSPQNTFVPGIVELAETAGVFIGGDDFKSGQTKMKSVLVDFLVGAGIKPTSIVSYNHLGNNDGKNLSAPHTFRAKEVSKSNVVDDMVASNPILYKPGEHPDHVVVIKYVPSVADSKRAMDEYTSEIFLGGKNTIVMHNTCEDSLLAAPLILDLVMLTEFCQRVSFKSPTQTKYERLNSVLSILSYMLKAPMVPAGTPVINALFKQRSCIENFFRATVGLPPENNMLLEHKSSICLQDFIARS